jgi:signal peptidase I
LKAKILSWIFPFFTALIVIFTVKAFWFFIVVFHGSSMASGLSDGDILLCTKISKIKIGDRIFYQENDSVSGNVKRLAALAGDTLLIENGKLSVNRTEYHFPWIIQRYRIISRASVKYDSDYIFQQNKNGFYTADLSAEEEKNIEKNQKIRIKKMSYEKEINQKNIFPRTFRFPWNESFFGQVVVPKKNKTVKINPKNIRLYQEILSEYENQTVEIRKGKIFISGKNTNQYTFKNDYIFVLNDDRTDTQDSREFGFLLLSAVKGKVWKIIYHSK